MKRIIIAILAAVIAVTVFAPTAEAASGARKRDTPGCVTKAEYKSVRKGMTMAQVRRIFDTPGRTTSRIDTSYSDWVWGDYVEGYEESYWVDGYWDPWSEVWVDGYWDFYWVDGYWEDDYEVYVSQIDYFRDYKKCKSFQRGKGRVAINFDNYSSARSGQRVYSKAPKRPWIWNALGLRTNQSTDLLAGKDVPTPQHTGPSSHNHEVTPEPAQPQH